MKKNTLRKMMSLLLCVILAVSLAACDGGTPTRRDDDNNDPSNEADVTPTGEVTPAGTTPAGEATPTVTEEPTPIATATPTGTADPTPTAAETPTPVATATPTTAATATPTSAATVTPTPTKAPTATPTPLPLPDPLPDIEDFMYERPNKALLAFAEYLDDKCWELGTTDDLHYGLCFINSDETPELWYAESGAHAESVTVCMFDGNKVIELGSYGQFGSFTYMPKCHTIVSKYSGMGHYDESVILLNGTKTFTAFDFEKVEAGSGYVYYVNGDECSKADYDDRYNAWQIDKYTTVGYEDGISVFNGEDGKSITYTQYINLFNSYLKFYSTNPFKYGIPEDIYETLLGTWTAECYEVEGGLYYCKDNNVSREWEFSKIGEQKMISSHFGDAKTVVPVNGKCIPGRFSTYDLALSLWRIEFEDPANPTYYFELWMHADGTLYERHWSGVDKYACVYTLHRK